MLRWRLRVERGRLTWRADWRETCRTGRVGRVGRLTPEEGMGKVVEGLVPSAREGARRVRASEIVLLFGLGCTMVNGGGGGEGEEGQDEEGAAEHGARRKGELARRRGGEERHKMGREYICGKRARSDKREQVPICVQRSRNAV